MQKAVIIEPSRRALCKHPAVRVTMNASGMGGFLASNQGIVLIILKDLKERRSLQGKSKVDIDTVCKECQGMLFRVPGILPLLKPMPVLDVKTSTADGKRGKYFLTLTGLEQEDFFYVVSAGDPKASAGQAELLALFDADGAACSRSEWSAQDDAETQNSAVAAMLAEGNSANFVTFTLGTTLAEGQSAGGGAGEHMTSFDYAYKLEAVRDWLFEQSR